MKEEDTGKISDKNCISREDNLLQKEKEEANEKIIINIALVFNTVLLQKEKFMAIANCKYTKEE